jgi:RNA repair pathway DNA polymerase beta family
VKVEGRTSAHPASVEGERRLACGFAHPHSSEEARAIAEAGMILRVQVGSGMHGTSVTGQDDRDEMGLCLEPARHVTGLARVQLGLRPLVPPSTSRSTSATPHGTGLAAWTTGRGRVTSM